MNPFKLVPPLGLLALTCNVTLVQASADTDAAASADLDSGHEAQLDDVTVNGRKTTQPLTPGNESADSSVTTIDAAQLDRIVSTGLDDALRYEPGVSITPNTRGGGGIGSINIRGLDGDRVTILIDGLTMPDSYTPTSSTYLNSGRNSIDIDSLAQMKIVKGGDVSAGSGALGGVVEFRTKDADDYLAPDGNDTYFSLGGSYRSDANQYSESATVANRTGKVESLVVYTHRESDETENHSGAAHGTASGADRASPDPGSNLSNNVLAKFTLSSSASNRVGVVGEYFDSQSAYDLYSQVTTTDPEVEDDDIKRYRGGLFGVNTASNVAWDRLQWQVDYQRAKTLSLTDNPSSGNSYNRYYQQDGIQARVDLTKQWGDHRLSYGADYQHQSYENLVHETASGVTTTSRFSPEADGDIGGLYLQDSWNLGSGLSLLPALRYDSYTYKPRTDQYVTDDWGTSRNDKLTGQLGVNWQATQAVSIYGRYGTGFRAPTLENLYYYYEHSGTAGGYSYGYLIEPNPDLKPETSHFAELGLRVSGALGNAQIAAYDNRYKNFIQQQYSLGATSTYPTGVFTTVNLNNVEIKGLELQGALDLAAALHHSALQGLKLSTSLAYAKGTYDNYEDASGNVTHNMPLDSISPMQAVTAISYDAPDGRWGSALHWTWTDAKKASDITSSNQWLATPSASVVDVTGYWQVTTELRLAAGAYNLFDEKYWLWDQIRQLSDSSTNLDRYTRPGRNYGLSLRYSF